jgi:hypothetical protein
MNRKLKELSLLMLQLFLSLFSLLRDFLKLNFNLKEYQEKFTKTQLRNFIYLHFLKLKVFFLFLEDLQIKLYLKYLN